MNSPDIAFKVFAENLDNGGKALDRVGSSDVYGGMDDISLHVYEAKRFYQDKGPN